MYVQRLLQTTQKLLIDKNEKNINDLISYVKKQFPCKVVSIYKVFVHNQRSICNYGPANKIKENKNHLNPTPSHRIVNLLCWDKIKNEEPSGIGMIFVAVFASERRFGQAATATSVPAPPSSPSSGLSSVSSAN
jgi:hypothetical protein